MISGYGINKLQIMCVVEDEKVNIYQNFQIFSLQRAPLKGCKILYSRLLLTHPVRICQHHTGS